MAASARVYPMFPYNTLQKKINLTTDPLALYLLTAYTFSTSHSTMADVLGAGTEVATGGGYTQGGLSLTGVTLSPPGTSTTLTFTNPSWGSTTTISAQYGVVADKIGGTNATNYAFLYWDFGTVQISNSGPFTITLTNSTAASWTA